MKNLIIASCTILFLIFTSCQQDFITDSDLTAVNNTDQQSQKAPSPERNENTPIPVGSLDLDCIPNSNFVVRSTFDDQTNTISFEYYTNSASNFALVPVSIDWQVSDGQLVTNDSGNETDTGFSFNTNFNVGFNIIFDDSSTFQDQLCVNISQFRPGEFNVCSNHLSTIGCTESKSRGEKRALVIVDIAF